MSTVIPLRMGELDLPFARYVEVVYADQTPPAKSKLLKRWISLGMKLDVQRLSRQQQKKIGEIPYSEGFSHGPQQTISVQATARNTVGRRRKKGARRRH